MLLFESFSNHCLANAIEPFRAANSIARRPLYSWQHISLDGGTVTSSSGLPVATSSWDEADPRGISCSSCRATGSGTMPVREWSGC